MDSCRTTIAALLLAFAAPSAHAQTPPLVDGDLTDLLRFAEELRDQRTGVGIELLDPTADVMVTDPLARPCPRIVERYFANGFDLERLVVAQAKGGATLWIGLRTAGTIGDTDGNGDPDGAGGSACDPDERMRDLPGVGADEQYVIQFDAACGPVFLPTSDLRLVGNRLSGSGAFAGVSGVEGDGTFAFRGPTGRDLEIRLADRRLPPGFRVRAITGSMCDGLSEDSGPVGTWQPHAALEIATAAPRIPIRPGGTARLAASVTNRGDVELSAEVQSLLPPGLAYAGNAASTCATGVPRVDESVVAWPAIRLAAGASCALGFDVLARSDCAGTLTARLVADGQVEVPACVSPPPSHAEALVELACDVPQVGLVVSAAPAGMVDAGTTLHYTLTVTNPSATVALDSAVVTDRLCALSTYEGAADPAPATAPPLGATGAVAWSLGPLPPGGVVSITFDALVSPDLGTACQGADLACVNAASIDGYRAGELVHDEATYASPLECPPPPVCGLAGEGCLRDGNGATGGERSRFGGAVGPARGSGAAPGAAPGARWEHRDRDGATLRFRWASGDARVVACASVPTAPCPMGGGATRVDFVGTGRYTIGPDGPARDGNMVAYAIVRPPNACAEAGRDEYGIVVRDGAVVGAGTVVYRAEGALVCGELRLLGEPGGASAGGDAASGTEGGRGAAPGLLGRAYPNPFARTTTFAYRVPAANTRVEIGVHDVAGRLVRRLDAGWKAAGTHAVTWDGTDDAGARVRPGIYFLRARVGAEQALDRVLCLAR